MTQVVEDAKVIFIFEVRGLGKRGRIFPCTGIGRRTYWYQSGVLLGDQQSAILPKQVTVLWILIVELRTPLSNVELSKEDCLTIALIAVLQQPNVIAFARCGISNSMEVNV